MWCWGGMSKVMRSFVCGGCMGPLAGAGRAGVDFGISAGLELVDWFSCLGGMLGVNGGAGAAVDAWYGVDWSGFGQLVPLLVCRGVSLVMGKRGCAVVLCKVVCCVGVGSGLWEGRVEWCFGERGWNRQMDV